MATTLTARDLARLPKDWLKAPVFPPRTQKEPRSIRVGENTWHMGVANPLAGGDGTPAASAPIDMSHVRVLLAVLSFWRGQNPVALSMNELAHRVAGSAGGGHFRRLRRKLDDLCNYWIALETPDEERATFAALRSVAARSGPAGGAGRRGEEVWLSGVTLWPQFAELLNRVDQLAVLRLDALRLLTSDLAQSLYLFVPSRAHHGTQETPWEIRTELLWSQLGLEAASKSARKRLLTQNRRSVLAQLDGAETRYGRLRVVLAETADGLDHKLRCWQEGAARPGPFPPELRADDSKPSLLTAWRASGRTPAEYQRRLARRTELDPYEEGKLRDIGLDPANRFWLMAKALLGGHFALAIGQMALEVDSGKAPQNIARVLNWRLRREIAALPPAPGNPPPRPADRREGALDS